MNYTYHYIKQLAKEKHVRVTDLITLASQITHQRVEKPQSVVERNSSRGRN